jgi:hypothetical protein
MRRLPLFSLRLKVHRRSFNNTHSCWRIKTIEHLQYLNVRYFSLLPVASTVMRTSAQLTESAPMPDRASDRQEHLTYFRADQVLRLTD